MNHTVSEADPLDELIEDFLVRQRRGEAPQAAEYAARRPDLANRILDLFPALATLEDLGSVVGDGPRPGVGAIVGDQLGEYRLLREIGRGGMGVVFEAVQETLGRRVALKVLADRGAKGDHLARFQREARTAARLHHTNIVPVFGVGAERGVFFYAMQFIAGRSLAEVIEETRRARAGSTIDAHASTAVEGGTRPSIPNKNHFRAVARLGLQAAEALAYAHSQGVLHRDIKPSNLLIDAEETLWIADFGLAKDVEHEDLTGTGQMLGTLRYMAPERFKGEADAKSDVYALGATLFEAVALRAAFPEHDRLALVERITKSGAISLRSLEPSVPADLDVIVGKALALEPRDRYQDATAMAEDLRAFLADQPIKARRPGPVGLARRWCRRNPVVAGLAFSAFALLATALAIYALKNRELAGLLKQRDDAVIDSREANARAVEQLWLSLREEASAAIASQRPGSRGQALAALRRAAEIRPDPSLRRLVCEAMAKADIERIEPDSPDAKAPLAPYLTYRFDVPKSPEKWIYYLEVASGVEKPFPLSTRQVGAGYHNIDPTGARWFCKEGKRVLLRKWPDGAEIAELLEDIEQSRPTAFEWTANGDRLACVLREGKELRIVVFDGRNGKRLSSCPLWAGAAGAFPRFSPDGRFAVVRGKDAKTAEIQSVEDGKRICALAAGSNFVNFAWRHDGNRLATRLDNGHIQFWDGLEEGRPRVTVNCAVRVSPTTTIRFHPSGEYLLASAGMTDWVVVDAANGEIVVREGKRAEEFDFNREGTLVGSKGKPAYRFFKPEARRGLNDATHAGAQYILANGRHALTRARDEGAYRQTLWDMPAARRVGGFEERHVGDTDPSRFFLIGVDGDGTLMTVKQGLKSVPMEFADGRLQLGTAKPLASELRPVSVSQAFRTTDGRLFLYPGSTPWNTRANADGSPSMATILETRADGKQVQHAIRLSTQYAVDPAGKFLAGTFKDHTSVIDLTGVDQRNRLLKAPFGYHLSFSQDGRHLLVFGVDALSIWRTADWERVVLQEWKPPLVSYAACFHSDGKTYFVAKEDRLEWRAIDGDGLLLELPTLSKVEQLVCGPDGNWLLVAGSGLVAWDLHLLRKRLREMNLDWHD